MDCYINTYNHTDKISYDFRTRTYIDQNFRSNFVVVMHVVVIASNAIVPAALLNNNQLYKLCKRSEKFISTKFVMYVCYK